MSPLVKIDLSRPTGNFWIDNGLVALYRLFGVGEFESDTSFDIILKKLILNMLSVPVEIEKVLRKKYPPREGTLFFAGRSQRFWC